MDESVTSEMAMMAPLEDVTSLRRLNDICRQIVRELMLCPNSYIFFRPVDPVLDGAPDYFCQVRRQISFYEIQKKLDRDGYSNPDDFRSDVNEVWRNAQVYNSPGHVAHETAVLLAKRSQMLMARLPHFPTSAEKMSGMQRYVAMKLQRYRKAKDASE